MRAFAAILLFLCPAMASAGIKATYVDSSQKPDPSQNIVIEVADNGDARIGGPDQNSYGVVKGGEFYIVGKNEAGWTVARMADVASAFGQVTPQVLKDLFGAVATAAAKPSNLKVEEKGKRTLLGREGLLLSVTEQAKDAKPQLFLVSRDDDLKPVGRALEQFTYSFFVLLGGLGGGTPPAEMKKIKDLFALGTPLEIEGGYKLIGLDKAEVDPARVALPGKPQTVAEIKAGIKVTPTGGDEPR